MEKSRYANVASLTGKLSQLANGAIYSDTGDTIEFHDRKLDALEDIIESANGKPVLVAYWFKHDLSGIKKRFDEREIKSSKDITDWNAGKIPVAVIHPASAGHGLNLQAGGSTLIWFWADMVTGIVSTDQRPSLETGPDFRNRGDRTHHHKGTIDERILKALSKKELDPERPYRCSKSKTYDNLRQNTTTRANPREIYFSEVPINDCKRILISSTLLG